MVDGLMVHQEVETLEAIANAIGIGYEGNNQCVSRLFFCLPLIEPRRIFQPITESHRTQYFTSYHVPLASVSVMPRTTQQLKQLIN